MRRNDNIEVLSDVEHQVYTSYLAAHRAGTAPLDDVLAQSQYYEHQRLEDEPAGRRRRADVAFWDHVARRLSRAGDTELCALLREVIDHYLQEIRGHINDRIFHVMSQVMPPMLGLLLTGASPRKLLRDPWAHGSLDSAIILQGEVEALRQLSARGTVILAPTHVSNLDSMILGYAATRLGLPPFVYGAGLNLFGNPLLALFMHHLGAYTVDRRKHDPLYKEVLKAYATSLLHHGYNNLFFPGGTRSRSGAIEQRLKLGLLGTGVQAYVRNLQTARTHPNIYVVPATLSFQLVLEAETLIDDFLKDVGKARYIISDDEYSKPRRVLDFFAQLLGLDSKIYLTVGAALDPFGNAVDSAGHSLDPRGRHLDTRRFVVKDGAAVIDPQRDNEYTRELGTALQGAYMRDNTLQSTHVTARALFDLLRRHNPHRDLLRLVRAGGPVTMFPLRDLYSGVDGLIGELRVQQGRGAVRLAPSLSRDAADAIVSDALAHFAIYHRRAAAQRRGDFVRIDDRSLLFYYQNRLEGYAVSQVSQVPPALSSDHRGFYRSGMARQHSGGMS